MNGTHYTIDIKAPKEKVWDKMLAPDSYREWTGAFEEGSYYEGDWEKGSRIRFLSARDAGNSGMLGEIEENTPYDYLSIRTVAEIADGKEVTDSRWVGSHENYTFTEKDGVTTVNVELAGENMDDEIIGMFNGMWPQGLAKLKEICEK